MDRTAGEQTISGPGVLVYLMEEMTDARLRCEQLKHYIADAVDLVSKSEHKDHFWEVAGHLMQGIPETLFKLDKALSAAALAAGKLDYEALKQSIRPEKADELERVLEDARIRYVHRRSGEGTMIDPKTASASLRTMADTIDQTGQFPLGPMVTLLAALEGKEPVGVAPRMASVPVHGLVRPAHWLRSLADRIAAPRPNRAKLAADLRRVLLGAISADMLAVLQTATTREEVMDKFKKENPNLTQDQLNDIANKWQENKDVVTDKAKQAGDKTAQYQELAAMLHKAMWSWQADWLRKVYPLAAKLEDALQEHGQDRQAKLLRDAMTSIERGKTDLALLASNASDFKAASDDRTAADMSPALTAFATAFDTAKGAWMAAQRGNERLTATMGLGTIANMASALSAIAPEKADELGRITSLAMRMLPTLKSEAAKGDVLTASAGDEFQKINPKITDAQKDAINKAHAENKDNFRAADWKAVGASGRLVLRIHVGPGVTETFADVLKRAVEGVEILSAGTEEVTFSIQAADQTDAVNLVLDGLKKAHKFLGVRGRDFKLLRKTAVEADKDSKHEKGKEMTLEEVTEGWPQEKKDEFKRQNEEHKDEFKAASDAWKA